MGGVAFPTLKRWANELCAYGAGCCESEGLVRCGVLAGWGLGQSWGKAFLGG